MAATRLSPIYQNWPQDWSGQIRRGVSHCANIAILDETEILRLCCDASNKIHQSLGLHEGDLPFPFIADHCWERWTRFIRKPSTELHLPFIFLDKNEVPVPARLIFHEIRHQACTGSLYPGREMRGVLTDAEWDGAIEAALYHAEQNGFPIPRTSDLRWRVVLDQTPAAYKSSKLTPHRITGRSAGVTFLVALFHFFGKVAEWNTRQAFESIIALAALPTRDQAAKALIHLGGDESKKALALHGLGHDSGSQHLHVILAGSFAGFQNVELPPSVKITHAETVAQLKSAIQEIIRRERMSALEKPQALDFDDYLQLKRKGFVGREWLFEEIDLWRFESEERALLITGDPGSGKTSLVSELIHRNPGGLVIGYHCCQSNEIETLRPGRFVQSLAAMIASSLPAYAELLNGEHLTRVLGDERCEKDPGGAFLKGVLQPLQKIPVPDDGVRYILVDALDEASGFTGQRTLPDILASHIQRFPAWLRLVATTRNEPKVMQRLSGLRAKQIDASDPRNRQDLTTYLDQRLSEPSLAERLVASHTTIDDAVEHISRTSSGNFLYAVQVLDGIARDDYSLANLNALPRGLDGIYLDFFRRIFGHENTEAGETAYRKAKPLLQILCTALEPLTGAELAAASQLDAEEELPQLLRKLAQLLTRQTRVTGEETLTFHHKSVPDWLTTHLDTNAFAVGPTKGRERLAEFCRHSLAACWAKPGWYVRRHAVEHFLEVADWDSASNILCNIEYLNNRAQNHELLMVRSDFFEVTKALSGTHEKNSKFKILLQRIRCFQHFVASHMQPLQKHSDRTNFICQHAYLLSHHIDSLGDSINPVSEAGHIMLRNTTDPKAEKIFTWSANSNHNQLGRGGSFSDLILNQRYNSFALGRAGLSLDNLDESMSRIAISQHGFRCAYTQIIAIDDPRIRHSSTWGLQNRLIDDYKGNASLIFLQTETNTVCHLGLEHLGPGRIFDISISDCGRYLFFISLGDMTPIKFDTDTLNLTPLVPGRASRLAVSSSAEVGAILDFDSIKIWNLFNQQIVQQFNSKDVGHHFHSLSLSPDCSQIVASDDKILTILDVNGGFKVCEIRGHSGWFRHTSLNSSAALLASAGEDGSIRIWNSLTGSLIIELSGHEGAIRSVHLSGDGQLLYSWGMDETIRIWRITNQKCLLLLYLPGACRFSVRTDEHLAAVGFVNGDVELYRIDNLISV